MTRWERFATREPHFAILASPKFLKSQLTPAHEHEFFESGERLVSYLFQLVEQRLAPDFSPTAILEYGCGIGRLALPLARSAATRGGRVLAVDRSPAMLDGARREAARHGADNISFLQAGEFAHDTRRFDFISCYLVLQRMPPGQGMALIRDLVSRLTPGGVAVFLVPYAATASPITRASRWLRHHLPPLNTLVNFVRWRGLDETFVQTYTYDLSRVMSTLQDQTAGTTNVLLEPHEGLATALVFVEAPMAAGETARSRRATIDVSQLIQTTSIDELNRAAEEYFSTLTEWDHHLAKPFAQVEEAPRLLGGAAVLLQGLDLAPGLTVLEFGAGTGWLSRCLTQLGCRTILLDVSSTALEMAREMYVRLPVVGGQPAPQFLLFDGRRIDLPDASVDRIVCFHAFHHVPNPDDVIRECARVLAPGGIAGFAEPGPRHSRSSFSQFEMQTYKVVENDVDIHRIWRVAAACGFADIRMAIFHGPACHVSLEQFEEFIAGGPSADAWTASTRVFMRNMRTFFLVKEGTARVDSRMADALACTIYAELAGPPAAGEPVAVDVTIANTGRAIWLASDVAPGGVRVGAHLYDERGSLLAFDLPTAPLTDPPRDVLPRETVRCRLLLPPQLPGRYTVEIDCVSAKIAWFAPLGSKPFILTWHAI